MSSRIGVDIGGTFTDLVYYDDESGEVVVGKVPTTPASPERGCISAVREVVPDEVLQRSSYFLHGTTVGLNALLERRGAVVGMLIAPPAFCGRSFSAMPGAVWRGRNPPRVSSKFGSVRTRAPASSSNSVSA